MDGCVVEVAAGGAHCASVFVYTRVQRRRRLLLAGPGFSVPPWAGLHSRPEAPLPVSSPGGWRSHTTAIGGIPVGQP